MGYVGFLYGCCYELGVLFVGVLVTTGLLGSSIRPLDCWKLPYREWQLLFGVDTWVLGPLELHGPKVRVVQKYKARFQVQLVFSSCCHPLPCEAAAGVDLLLLQHAVDAMVVSISGPPSLYLWLLFRLLVLRSLQVEGAIRRVPVR